MEPAEKRKMKRPVTYAFIDSQNLNLGVLYDVVDERGKVLYKGQMLDYRRFRHYLREKFNVQQAFLFIGYVEENSRIYEYLEGCGYTMVYKEVVEFEGSDEKKIIKGNVDTDIVLYSAAIKFDEYEKAVFVSGDGDFVSLYKYLDEKQKLARILVPNRFRYSRLLRQYKNKIFFISNQRSLFAEKSKKTRSSGRITSLGMPGRRDNGSVSDSEENVNIVLSLDRPDKEEQ